MNRKYVAQTTAAISVLALSLILLIAATALTVQALPTPPTPKITLSPSSGPVGTPVTVTGFSYPGTATLTYFGKTTTITPSGGGFTAPFTVPASTMGNHQVTATENGRSASAQFTVTPMIASCNSAGTPQTTFSPGPIYCTGTGFQASTKYTIYLVQAITWTNGLSIPSHSVVPSFQVTSDKSGNLPTTIIPLSSTLQPGKYDIIVDVNNNGIFACGTDVCCSNVVVGTFFVMPEYTFGALAALGACFAALLVYKRKSLPSLHLNIHV